MADDLMVVVGGVRYRLEDAKRLGLVADPPVTAPTKSRKPANKARTPRNKGADDDDTAGHAR